MSFALFWIKLQIAHGQLFCQNGFNVLPFVMATFNHPQEYVYEEHQLCLEGWTGHGKSLNGHEVILDRCQPTN